MNPLVEKMLIAQREGIDARTLEQIFEHEAKCQSAHDHKENLYCSGEVKSLGFSCSDPLLLCDAAAHYWARSVTSSTARCRDCIRFCSECWTIRPI